MSYLDPEDPEISVDLGANEHGPGVKKNPIHGTYCAAVIAAEANNSFCGVGVAFRSRVGGVRLLVKKRVMDVNEAKALNYQLGRVDIYSASWGNSIAGRGHFVPRRNRVSVPPEFDLDRTQRTFLFFIF